MLHEQRQTISMRSNVRELTRVRLVKTPCSHLHSFCAAGVSSGLATRVTLTRVSLGRLVESITRGWTCFWFHSCTIVRDCFWVAFQNRPPCTTTEYEILSSHGGEHVDVGLLWDSLQCVPKVRDYRRTVIWQNTEEYIGEKFVANRVFTIFNVGFFYQGRAVTALFASSVVKVMATLPRWHNSERREEEEEVFPE
jgi:hypothetical protein